MSIFSFFKSKAVRNNRRAELELENLNFRRDLGRSEDDVTRLNGVIDRLEIELCDTREKATDREKELAGMLDNADKSRLQQIRRAEAAEAEVKRLQAEIDRKSSMPGDHRYWEGRYRDEAAANEQLREALTPFVSAFESRREIYSKRYRSNRELGYANFDKMPDDWAMEKVAFNMGTYRRARTALASTGGEHHADR